MPANLHALGLLQEPDGMKSQPPTPSLRPRRLPERAYRATASLGSIAIATMLGLACTESFDFKSCQQGCGEQEVCETGECVCVPRPGPDEQCPAGHLFERCGTHSCRYCRDCIPICTPEKLLQEDVIESPIPIGAQCGFQERLRSDCTCQPIDAGVEP